MPGYCNSAQSETPCFRPAFLLFWELKRTSSIQHLTEYFRVVLECNLSLIYSEFTNLTYISDTFTPRIWHVSGYLFLFPACRACVRNSFPVITYTYLFGCNLPWSLPLRRVFDTLAAPPCSVAVMSIRVFTIRWSFFLKSAYHYQKKELDDISLVLSPLASLPRLPKITMFTHLSSYRNIGIIKGRK